MHFLNKLSVEIFHIQPWFFVNKLLPLVFIYAASCWLLLFFRLFCTLYEMQTQGQSATLSPSVT